MVQIVEELPGTAVAQTQLARRLRKRTHALDVLKERNLPRAYGGRRPKINAQANIKARRIDHARYVSAILYLY
jgi:hypothetical protein